MAANAWAVRTRRCRGAGIFVSVDGAKGCIGVRASTEGLAREIGAARAGRRMEAVRRSAIIMVAGFVWVRVRDWVIW